MLKAIDSFMDRIFLKLYDATEFIDSFLKRITSYGKT